MKNINKKSNRRQAIADVLIGEIYDATHYDVAKFKPMDPRRIKRLINIYDSTTWDDAETVNRLIGASICSANFRKNKRKGSN